MEIEFAFLANYAEVQPNGLIVGVGIGWDVGFRSSYPAAFGGYVVAKVRLTRQEMSHQHNVELDIIDADGHEIVPRMAAAVQAPVVEGSLHHLNLIFDLRGAPVPKTGTYTLELGLDGRSLKSFAVTFNPPPPQQGLAPTG